MTGQNATPSRNDIPRFHIFPSSRPTMRALALTRAGPGSALGPLIQPLDFPRPEHLQVAWFVHPPLLLPVYILAVLRACGHNRQNAAARARHPQGKPRLSHTAVSFDPGPWCRIAPQNAHSLHQSAQWPPPVHPSERPQHLLMQSLPDRKRAIAEAKPTRQARNEDKLFTSQQLFGQEPAGVTLEREDEKRGFNRGCWVQEQAGPGP